MKKRIIIFSLASVLILLAISFTTAVSTTTSTEKKESPLYKIRTQSAIQEKKEIIKEKMHNFFVKLIGNRIFLRIPLLKRNDDSSIGVLSRGGACTLIKCSLDNEDSNEIGWTKIQLACVK